MTRLLQTTELMGHQVDGISSSKNRASVGVLLKTMFNCVSVAGGAGWSEEVAVGR